MPFAKSTPTPAAPSEPVPAEPVPATAMPPQALAQHIAQEGDLALRAYYLDRLVALASPEAGAALTGLLHHGDPAVRAAGVDGLRRMPPAVFRPALAQLLGNPSPDVRIRALDAVDRVPDAEMENWLIALLEKETDTNVCGAVLDLLADIGTQASVPALRCARLRFANAPFVAYAADLVLARIAEG